MSLCHYLAQCKTKPEYDVLSLSFGCLQSNTVKIMEELVKALRLYLGIMVEEENQQQKSGPLGRQVGTKVGSSDEPELQQWHIISS